MKSGIRIVLVGTTHPGNIGAVARAMKNMDLHELVLAGAKCDHQADAAMVRASGAQDVLLNAQVQPDLVSATADCHLVIGSSARQRSALWFELKPRDCATLLTEQATIAPVSLVFGRESTGLTAAELDICTHLVQIPTNPAYTSLNIAMAVQILAYELYLQSKHPIASAKASEPPAQIAQMEGFFAHLHQTLHDIDFLQTGRESKAIQRLRRLFHRAQPSEREVHILRGILSAMQRFCFQPGVDKHV